MCGIAGIISHRAEPSIDAALSAIEHRGRDDEGTFVSERFGDGFRAILGHRRLSIIDTSSAGHQPMRTADGRFTLILNGEIYNYREIRAELVSKGVAFRSGSDTEVVLEAFRSWGADCLEKLNGMFAFAVWDDAEKLLTLVRDRAGIKPLYYAQVGDEIVFASEIKAILATGLVPPTPDNESLDQFLTFLWPVPPRTLFKGIQQVLPGHFLRWKDARLSHQRWWDLDFSHEERDGEGRAWAERVLESLDRATEMEMVADVPVGAFLSGGVDSSSITALMARHSKHRVSTYTTGIAASDLEYDIIPDDIEFSRRVASLLPIDYHEKILSPDLADLLPKLIWHMDAPVIDMAIPSFLISSEARGVNKVMLSGMGGDEVFAGYPRHLAMKLAAATDLVPGAVRRPLFSTIDHLLYGGLRGPLTAPLRNAKKFARSAAMEFEERYLGFGTYFTREMKAALYNDNMASESAAFDPYRYHRECFRAAEQASPLNRLLYVDFKTFMPALNLDTTDKMSMAANLEVRVPFLNKDLVELSTRIPTSLKIKGLKRKFILKKAAERLLPADVIWRKKAGFGAPIRSWLRGPLRPMLDDLLSEETVRSRGLFRPEAVRELIDRNASGREDLSLHLFALLGLEIWFRTFIDDAGRR